jgi:putative oxidoreductase
MPNLRAQWAPRLLSVLRIVAAFMFIAHGTSKLFAFPPMPGQPAHTMAVTSLPGAAGAIELVGGTLVLLGLFTSPVAFLLAGEMAVAYFMVHAPNGIWPLVNHGELAVLYCFVWLYIWAAGPGPWSLDAMRSRGLGAHP